MNQLLAALRIAGTPRFPPRCGSLRSVASAAAAATTKAPQDSWTNATPAILAKTGRMLHSIEKNPHHPLALLNARIHEILHGQNPEMRVLDSAFPDPVVTPKQNFDDLLIPPGHPSRSRSDTYYLSADRLLRTHTSAHQSTVFAQRPPLPAWVLTADVFRRDEVNASHYPVFHQMEGAWTFPAATAAGEVAVLTGTAKEPTAELAIVAHLRLTVDRLIRELFRGRTVDGAPLQVRWVDAYFPFTQPSFEVEVWFRGQWLEVLGCGVVQPAILQRAGLGDRAGWAFGLGLERLAMALFDIPDIRLFWTDDARFTDQFRRSGLATRFEPYSRCPPCYKDVSFWLPTGSGGSPPLHANDLADLVRSIAGDVVEDVALIDAFAHPRTGRQSQCYRINYRSMDRSLSNDEVNVWQDAVVSELVGRYGVSLR